MGTREEIEAAITRHLAVELGGAAVARELAAVLWDAALSWAAPTVPRAEIGSIMAFTFGNRIHPNGNREPGPVNEQLADAAVALHGVAGAPIYAQWEIAEAIGSRVAPGMIVPIYPPQDARAGPVYLGTTGVVAQIAQLRDPASLGAVGVIAFADHMARCVQAARRFGFLAAAPEGLAMPSEYDPDSGQPWCRFRLAYLLHDIMLRISDRREAELARR